MNKVKVKSYEKPTYDVARSTAVKLTATIHQCTNEYVRAILKRGTSSLKSVDILKTYNKKYAEISKVINN